MKTPALTIIPNSTPAQRAALLAWVAAVEDARGISPTTAPSRAERMRKWIQRNVKPSAERES